MKPKEVLDLLNVPLPVRPGQPPHALSLLTG